jgi:hypothetical protein
MRRPGPRVLIAVAVAVAITAAGVSAALAAGPGKSSGGTHLAASGVRGRGWQPRFRPPPPDPRSGQPRSTAPAAVAGFDESGVSTGLGDNFSAAQWGTIRADGFRLFITDPIQWSSECSDGNCTSPVGTCTLDPAAVAQIQYAYDEGIDYAVYTRNVNCLRAAITGLPRPLQAHLSFAILDIEPGPSVPLTTALINGVTSLGQTPVVYSYQSGWDSVMGSNTGFSSYPLDDGIVPNWGAQFPAAYPSGYPSLVSMPYSFGGWSGYGAEVEQQSCCSAINGRAGAIDNSSDQVDLDSVNAAWLASLPHQA